MGIIKTYLYKKNSVDLDYVWVWVRSDVGIVWKKGNEALDSKKKGGEFPG